MAIVHFTVKEVRALLEKVMPGYQKEFDTVRVNYEEAAASWKRRYEEEKEHRDKEPERREKKLRANAREDHDAQEKWRGDHPIRALFEREKTEEEFYEERKRNTIWYSSSHYGLSMFMYRPQFPEHTNLTLCEGLSKKLEGYEEDRVVGLQPHEAEVLKANENTT